MKQHILPLAFISLAVACSVDTDSDSTGLSTESKLNTLSNSELADMCSWFVAMLPESITCDESDPFDLDLVGLEQECTTDFQRRSAECTATVAQFEACVSDIASNLCTSEPLVECEIITPCW